MRCRHAQFRRRRSIRSAAFTLVEVLLALGIGSALLVFAMLFYRQAAELRTQILQESDRLATLRLVMDRLASDLRTAQGIAGRSDAFSGGSNWISFVRMTVPNGPSAAARSGSILRRIAYAAPLRVDGTNSSIAGLTRVEDSPDAPSSVVSGSASTNAVALSESAVADPAGPDGASAMVGSNVAPQDLMTDLVRFLRFRYWDGAAWLEGWTNAMPPSGVEVVISTEAAPIESAPETAAASGSSPGANTETSASFRRVIFIPTGLVVRRGPVESFTSPTTALAPTP